MDNTTNGNVAGVELYHDLVQERYGSGDHYVAAVTLMRAARVLTDAISMVLEGHQLTMPQWSVLTMAHLAPNQPIALGRFAKALGVHGTTITNAVDRLVSMGLVKRVADESDRRSVFATVTKTGAKRADAVMRELADRAFGLADLDDAATKSLIEVLTTFSPFMGDAV